MADIRMLQEQTQQLQQQLAGGARRQINEHAEGALHRGSTTRPAPRARASPIRSSPSISSAATCASSASAIDETNVRITVAVAGSRGAARWRFRDAGADDVDPAAGPTPARRPQAPTGGARAVTRRRRRRRRPPRAAPQVARASRRSGCTTRRWPTTRPASGRCASRASTPTCAASRAARPPTTRSSTSASATTRTASSPRRWTPTTA